MATYQKKQNESTTTTSPSNLGGKVPTLQDRMSKFGEGSANKKIDKLKTRFNNSNSNEEETSTTSPPPPLTTRPKKSESNSLKDRMAKFGGGSKPLPPNPISPVIITPSKIKKTDHQLRMEKFHEATSSSACSGSLSDPVTSSIVLPAKQTVKVGSLQDRMNMYKQNAAPSSQLDDFATLSMKKKLQLKKKKEEEEEAAAAEKKTFKVRTKVGSVLQQRMSAFEKKSADVKPPPEEGQTDVAEPVVVVEKSQVQSKNNDEVDGPQDVTPKDTEENAPSSPKVSSVEQTKLDDDNESSITVPSSLADLQNLVSAFAEVSSQLVVHDADEPKPAPSTSPVSFQEDKLVEERDSPKSVSAFVGVSESSSETLKKEEEQAANDEEEDVAVKEEEGSSVDEDTTTKPDDEKGLDDTSNEVEHVLEDEVKPNDEVDEAKPEQVAKEEEIVEEETLVDKVDEAKPDELVEDTPAEDEVKPNEKVAELNPQEGEAQGGEKKEVSPTEYEYLYDLYVKFELLKSHPRNKILLEGGSNALRQRDTDIKASLEGIIGGNTHYTAKNRDWLNKDWIEEHMNDGCFKFRDPSLFKTFDKTNEKSRDKIIRTFVKQLLRYANDITQLDLSSCLLPDKFLEDFAEAILRKPAQSFPNLQLINVESNELKGPGIEALSKVVANKSALRYLQVILLENQKHTMTSEAEKSLADAVSQSASIVVCSVAIRCQFARKEINDAILYNTDQMRLARRDQQAKDGTLKERKRNDMELYFDSIASEECDETEVEIVGDQQFLTLEEEEKIKAGKSFATNTSVKSIKMNLLGLNDSFAEAFGNSLEQNNTIKKINIDSNAITGKGMIACE